MAARWRAPRRASTWRWRRRSISPRRRTFAYSNAFGAVLGLLGAALVGLFLGAFPFPLNFSLCFASASAVAMLSYLVLGRIREPPEAPRAPAGGFGATLRRIPGILRADREFAWYLVGRVAGSGGALATGFYTAHALRVFQAPVWQVAGFTSALLAVPIVANFAFGHLGDRRGYKLVYALAVGMMIAAKVVALAASGVGWFYGVFALSGAAQGGTMVASWAMSLEFAPEGQRPTSVAIASAAMAPAVLGAPLLGGVVADRAGYPPVYALAIAFSLVALLVIVFRTRDPRARAPGRAGRDARRVSSGMSSLHRRKSGSVPRVRESRRPGTDPVDGDELLIGRCVIEHFRIILDHGRRLIVEA